MDAVPNYTAVTDLPLQWQGDTLPAMGFQIDYPDATPMIPESVCAVLMNKSGVAVWTYDANIDPVTGRSKTTLRRSQLCGQIHYE